MKVIETNLHGVVVLEPQVLGDHRGYFFESYNERRAGIHGLMTRFVQDNESFSEKAGVLRGLHYQIGEHAQTKLVRVASGSIFDVAVDIRKGSSTFGRWFGTVLSAQNKRQLYIPKGMAHGFCTLEEGTTVLYKADSFYHAASDRGIRWDDPHLAIDWPVDVPILSGKDESLPGWEDADFE
ncbi:dTDP-4-dehydrorhamnose 3,5-epimerase [Rossellomorea marisflavi]|uniref:dTDP-4-dehydrorhamnose 3,5-epimerase n=1 Tax=Rossellomorea marisflavi TaxID=189381 RepID=UPI00064E17C4|nr:dTDP-4-dehydrorhamnose 3,5-epimerase [Rossellomorea marisflavi]KMK91962.1 dTDP-4-dehydrorhamnose 3,5-epimerase [Rossellomorea marisflavi]MCM2606234.1 dTDP-4-dehydrorhamnose 3,5-epimerase [Rossellomorea marisflavi]